VAPRRTHKLSALGARESVLRVGGLSVVLSCRRLAKRGPNLSFIARDLSRQLGPARRGDCCAALQVRAHIGAKLRAA